MTVVATFQSKTVGETQVVEANFEDRDDVPYNPTTTYMRVLSPSGALTTVTGTNPAVGQFFIPFIGTARGIWRFWVHGEGPGVTNNVIEPGSVCFEEGL